MHEEEGELLHRIQKEQLGPVCGFILFCHFHIFFFVFFSSYYITTNTLNKLHGQLMFNKSILPLVSTETHLIRF